MQATMKIEAFLLQKEIGEKLKFFSDSEMCSILS